MAVKHLNTALQIKAVDQTERIIEGYAAVFGNRDRTGDVIEQGAFDKTIRTNRDVLIFIGHNASSLTLGETLEMRADRHGLFTKTRIYHTTAGDDLLTVAHARMAAGKSLGMSIGYRVPKGGDRLSTTRGGDGLTRHLNEIDLVEYSFLASPDMAANPLAQSTNVKDALESKPYRVVRRDGKFCVVGGSNNRTFGCHPTEAEAHAQMRALYASEKWGARRKKPMLKVLERDGKWVIEEDDGTERGSFSTETDARTAVGLFTDDNDDEGKAEWDTAYINNLPDSAFALIDGGGHKDEEGKTVPRSLRHYPHHNADGGVDLPHLRNALSRAAQQPNGDKVLPHLKRHASAAGIGKAMLEYDDAHEPQWTEWGAPSELLLQLHKMDELLDAMLDDYAAMSRLGIDTKAGRKLKTERLAKLKEVIAHLQEVVDWAEAVDRGDDGKSQADWYRQQAEIFELELEVA